MVDAPLKPQEFAGLSCAFTVREGERVAVAVSGGPDSMALSFCLARWLGAERIVALIVEHGLRPESADEARGVKERLQTMGLEVEILPWIHEEFKSRIHVRARDARYGLLIGACRKCGISKLFLAHHADDQAETVLMRLAKGSGIAGLAGIAPVTVMEDVTLLRPFLAIPKARLLATCEANNVAFVSDPSNEADKYARGRLRRVMPLLAQEGLSPERLTDLADRAREAKDALEHYAQTFLRSHAELIPGGAVRLDVMALRGQPRATAMRSVAAILAWLHEGRYPPERKHLGPFVDWLMDQDAREARTLHGVFAQKGEMCARVTFSRELSSVTDRQPIGAGQTLVWDGRWRVSCNEKAEAKGWLVAPLGIQTHAVLDQLAPALRKQIPQGRIRAGLPALWHDGQLVLIPCFSEKEQSVARAILLPPSWS